ncbi:MAG TPA: DUF3180 domain-containing protein [Nocardioidaceae bacterium]|jgi:hypothetical protein|nr:DUF3180 domain-containing protein [Nocardioidaceae bacterium]
MSRDGDESWPGESRTDDEQEPGGTPGPGHLRPTGPGVLVGFALTGLVLGWLLRPVSIQLRDAAPTVGWLPVLALAFVAVIVGAVAWATYRLQRGPERIEPHRMVNRLVLAKACALVGALVGGGYLGYAFSWVGLTEAQLAGQRMLQATLAALACVAIVTGSLLLERACRVRGGGGPDLR